MIVVDLITDNPEHKFSAHQRMVAVIINFIRAHGYCQLQDLYSLGFDRNETQRLWPMAKALADLELGVMTDKKHPLFNHRKEKHHVKIK